MPRRKRYQNDLSKLIFRRDRRLSLEDIPLKTMKATAHALKWMFVLIFMFITIGIIALFATGGQNYVQQILGYSITGFFTFFMGYFGWTLAQGVIDILVGKEKETDVARLSYYLKKNKKHKI